MCGVFVMTGWLLAACGATETSPGTGAAGAGGESAALAMNGAGETFVPPPAQGASQFSVKSSPSAPAGTQCPVTAADFGIPELADRPGEQLSSTRYLHKVIEGEDGVVFKCSVSGTGTFEFGGQIHDGGRALIIQGGSLNASKLGGAEILLVDPPTFSNLGSNGACAIRAAAGASDNLQVRPGSMWASFECPAMEGPRNAFCQATGYFVLENCSQ